MSSAEGIGYVAFSRPINSKSTQIGAGLGMRCGAKAVDGHLDNPWRNSTLRG
jgi:hypothetical protein